MYGGTKKQTCAKCQRDISVNNYIRHVEACQVPKVKEPKVKKVRGVDFDPNWGYAAGKRQAWNKGRRTKPDNRNPLYIGKNGGYRENAGRSKKFRVKDSYGVEVVLQSTYELECSEILNALGIIWVRPKSLLYDGKRYYPDFYLPEYDIYLDPKNSFKAKQDEDKIQKVVDQNNVTIYVVLKEHLNKEWFCNLVGKIGD